MDTRREYNEQERRKRIILFLRRKETISGAGEKFGTKGVVPTLLCNDNILFLSAGHPRGGCVKKQ